MTAGGTGGHMFPAVSVACILEKKGYEIFLITDSRGAQYIQEHNVFSEVFSFSFSKLSGNFLKKTHSLLKLMISFFRAFFLIIKHKPVLVWGFGGIASAPALLAGKLLGIPTGIHQSDAILGRTNRLLAKWVDAVATSFPETPHVPKNTRMACTGMPIRKEIENLSQESYATYSPHTPCRILVLGGSQGAAVWSDILPKTVKLLPPSTQKYLEITQQCRPEYHQQTAEAYAQTLAKVHLIPFIKNMEKALAEAHLVISRAGASTVAELAASGRPTLFVPYPFALDNHQFYNGKKVTDIQGGWMILETELNPEILKIFLEDKLQHPKKLENFSQKIRLIWQKRADIKLADFMEICLKETEQQRKVME